MHKVSENSSELKHGSHIHMRNNMNTNQRRKNNKTLSFYIFAVFTMTIRDVFDVC